MSRFVCSRRFTQYLLNLFPVAGFLPLMAQSPGQRSFLLPGETESWAVSQRQHQRQICFLLQSFRASHSAASCPWLPPFQQEPKPCVFS